MEAVAKALLTAKEEVFITDWWLSPEIMLIRPTDDESFRLDNLLGRIAVSVAERALPSEEIARSFVLGLRCPCLRDGLQRGFLRHRFEQSSHQTRADRQEQTRFHQSSSLSLEEEEDEGCFHALLFLQVIRHPDHYPSGGVFLWSHHEKLVIIDQKIAFVGGIDLCFGRWDDEFMR